MSAIKYKVGDRVRIKNFDWFRNEGAHNMVVAYMKKYYGKVVTIKSVHKDFYRIKEDDWQYCWTDEMIEGLVEESKPEFDYVAAMDDLMGLDIERSCILNEYDEYQKAVKVHDYNSEEALTRKTFIHLRKIGTAQNILENFGFNLPEDYIFKDENGNIISATKIVLEKKKNEYPKTYKECCKVLDIQGDWHLTFESNNSTSCNLCFNNEFDYVCRLEAFRKLLICRDAYWKLAGEQMGLDKPWEPNWTTFEGYPAIYMYRYQITLSVARNEHHRFVFPSVELRDKFYENFKEEIEICKEFL